MKSLQWPWLLACITGLFCFVATAEHSASVTSDDGEGDPVAETYDPRPRPPVVSVVTGQPADLGPNHPSVVRQWLKAGGGTTRYEHDGKAEDIPYLRYGSPPPVPFQIGQMYALVQPDGRTQFVYYGGDNQMLTPEQRQSQVEYWRSGGGRFDQFGNPLIDRGPHPKPLAGAVYNVLSLQDDGQLRGFFWRYSDEASGGPPGPRGQPPTGSWAPVSW